ncbi:MAG: organoarsenical effux MFS transporter ArsJ [Planctomycetes bacterium]|nr:organoarsenical effux MFS transporter ArsJ [Planctomycetota bacterium]
MRDELRHYAIVTACYWAFTLSDGALRMLVLFHLHGLGYAPLEVISLFLFYELFGIVTNAIGGYLGARTGLKVTLTLGLALQIGACGLLAACAEALSVPLALLAQAVSGIAKDLTKMSAKSYLKVILPNAGEGALLRWVALLTGSKNALKGLGFFVGGALLTTVGFRAANLLLLALLAVALLAALRALPAAAGKSKSKAKFTQLFANDPRINWLAASRLFLFASRDAWFAFALPIYAASSLGWSSALASGFLACWVIGYGIVQALAPRWLGTRTTSGRGVVLWTAALLLPLGALLASLALGAPPALSLVLSLALFAFVFASDSALHSFLIVHFAAGDKVAMNVGFYYAANATGRFLGTLASGAVFQAAGLGASGLAACIAVSLGCVLLATLTAVPLVREGSAVVEAPRA